MAHERPRTRALSFECAELPAMPRVCCVMSPRTSSLYASDSKAWRPFLTGQLTSGGTLLYSCCGLQAPGASTPGAHSPLEDFASFLSGGTDENCRSDPLRVGVVCGRCRRAGIMGPDVERGHGDALLPGGDESCAGDHQAGRRP